MNYWKLVLGFLAALSIAAVTTDSDITGISGGSPGFITGSTDNAILRADGTGGLTSQSSACTITDGGRTNCTTDGTGTNEFDAITITNTSGGYPSLNVSAAASHFAIQIAGVNQALFDGPNLTAYLPGAVVVNNIMTASYQGLSLVNSGRLFLDYDPDNATSFAEFRNDSGSPDHLALLQVTSNKTSNRNLLLKMVAAQTANTFEIRDSSNAVTQAIAPDGGMSGFQQNQIASTTRDLVLNECGSTIVSNSADVVTLPLASTAEGCRFTFIVGNVSNFDVNPNDADQIFLLTNAANNAIRADAIGESVVLEAISGGWAPVGAEKGTWTDID